jgi:hypothetical protein
MSGKTSGRRGIDRSVLEGGNERVPGVFVQARMKIRGKDIYLFVDFPEVGKGKRKTPVFRRRKSGTGFARSEN